MDFFYLSDLRKRNLDTIPRKEIKCILYKGVYRPIIDGKVFIPMVGYVRGETYTIPTWDGNVNTFADYLEKYGMYALFYTITGVEYDTSKAEYWLACCEFASILSYCANDMGKYDTFVKAYKHFLIMVEAKLHEILNPNGDKAYMVELYLMYDHLKPVYNIGTQTIPPCVPMFNLVEKLVNLAVDIINNSRPYNEHLTVWGESDPKYKEIASPFIDKNCKAQIEHFYGKEIAELYDKLHKMYY